jgi:hypothetical protein
MSKQTFLSQTRSRSIKSKRSKWSRQQAKKKKWQRQRQWQRQRCSRWRRWKCREISQIVHRHISRDIIDNERHARSDHFLSSEQCMLSAQHSKKNDVHLLHDVLETHFCQRFKEFDDRNETRHRQTVLRDRQQTNEHFVLERFLRFEMFFKFDQFWSVKRNSLFHVVQIEFVHDRKSRHYNKKARQQRVLLWAVKACEL